MAFLDSFGSLAKGTAGLFSSKGDPNQIRAVGLAVKIQAKTDEVAANVGKKLGGATGSRIFEQLAAGAQSSSGAKADELLAKGGVDPAKVKLYAFLAVAAVVAFFFFFRRGK